MSSTHPSSYQLSLAATLFFFLRHSLPRSLPCLWAALFVVCLPWVLDIPTVTMASSSLAPEISSLVPLIKTLTNQHLRDLCRSESLAVSGVKATLQLRLIDCLSKPPLTPILRQRILTAHTP